MPTPPRTAGRDRNEETDVGEADRGVVAAARREDGASLVEYALLVGLIAVVCIGAVTFLGGKATEKFSSIGSSIQ